MKGDKVKAVREKYKLSQREFARALRLRGEHAWQTVSERENDARPVTGPVELLLELWWDPRCPSWAKPQAGG